MLKVSDINVYYGNIHAIKDISFEVAKGEIVSLIGACVFRIIWIFTVFRVQHTLFILYASYPISWILTILAHFVCYLIVRKKVFRPQET